MTQLAASTGDPDVLSIARTLAGERSVVLVLNNDRAAVDLAALEGGGVGVQGLLTDDAIADVTGTGGTLQVNAGRLRGIVPPLTALVLAES